jgi:hypothetical protein
MCDSERIMGLLEKLESGEIEEVEIVYRDIEVLHSELNLTEEYKPITIQVSSFELNSFLEGLISINDYDIKEIIEIDFDNIISIEPVEENK